MRYTIEPRDQIYVKGNEVSSYVKNMRESFSSK